MTARNAALPANALADWAETAQPGDQMVYHRGKETLDKPHGREFGVARKLAETGEFAIFTLSDKRVIVRLSPLAARFMKWCAANPV